MTARVRRIGRLRDTLIGRTKVGEFVDTETGEVIELARTLHDPQTTHVVPKPTGRIPNKYKTQHFTKLYREKIQEARMSKLLSYDEAAVLYAAVECIDWECSTVVNTKGQSMSMREFAEYIGKDKNWVCSVLNSLAAKQFVTLETKGRARVIRVASNIAYRGNSKH